MNLCIAYAGDLGYPSGGTDRVTALASGLQRKGFDVTLVVPEPGQDPPDRLDGVELHTVSKAHRGGLKFVRAVHLTRTAARIARERGALLQFEHSTLGGVGALHVRQPFVIDMHDLAYARFDHVDTPLAPVLRRGVGMLERFGTRRASHVVAVSEYMGTVLRERWGYEKDVTVLPNGYFPERVERFEGVDTETGRVCFLGTLHPKVDVETFAEIADLPGVRDFPVIGTGAQEERLRELADDHEALRVLGRLPDEEAFGIVASSAIAVNPQVPSTLQRASSPVKLYYYAALGRPMVVSPGPDIVDDLRARDAAVVADARSGFVESVDDLLSDDDRARRLASHAKAAATDFEWGKRIDAANDVYADLLQEYSRS